MHNYPSDISREEYNIIKDLLENAKKKTKPRRIDLYDIFCAVLYIIKGGIQWRMLPSDFPKWTTVFFYFQIWTQNREEGTTILDEALKKIGQYDSCRRLPGRTDKFLHYRRSECE